MPLLFLIVFLSAIGFGIMVPALYPYLRGMGIDPAVGSLIIALYAYAQFVGTPFWGLAADRWGRRPVILISMLGFAASYGMLALSDSLPVIIASRILGGLMAGNIAAAYAAAADLTTPENRARAMGVLGGGFGLAFILGLPLGGWLGGDDPAHPSLANPALVASVMSLVGFVATAILFRETQDPAARRKIIEAGAGLSGFAILGRQFRAMAGVARRPVLGSMMLLFLIFVSSTSITETIMPLWTNEQLGWSPERLGTMLAIPAVAVLIVQLGLIGTLVRTFGEQKLAGLAMIVYAAGMLVLILTSAIWTVPAGMALAGIGAAVFGSTMASVISKRATEHERGMVMGVQNSLFGLGRAFGPSLAGALYVAGPSMPFWINIAVMGVCLALLAVISRLLRRDRNNP